MKLFNIWDTKDVKVSDQGLKNYINISQVLVPRSHGRHAGQQFHKSKLNIVERLMNHLMCPGHRGRRHLLTSQQCTGKASKIYEITKEALKSIEKQTKKNPVEVLVNAIENASLREEITSFRVGGIMARKAVIASPQRRVDLTLRLIVQGAFQKSHKNPKGIAQCLADEIIACYNYDSTKANAIREKERIEREAMGAR